MTGPTIGIDLGTTNSAVAVFEDGTPRVLTNRLGEKLTPSAVALDPVGGGLLVGRPAKEILALHPDRAAANFKRLMGLEDKIPLGDTEYGAVELSALVLRHLKEDATAALGAEPANCVITVPAYFDDAQRYATVQAGELAGMNVRRVINEPTAAAMAHGVHKRESGFHFLVFDLGGGTFDVCIMEVFEGILQVKSAAGESQLGGEDFTRRLAGYVLDQIGLELESVELNDRAAYARLLKRSELAKRRLTESEQVEIMVPEIQDSTTREVSVTIGSKDAEAAWEQLIGRLAGPCRTALRGARSKRSDVEEVIFVGGATRMPCVFGFAQKYFEKEPVRSLDTDLAVVQGAAIQAALLDRDEAVEEIVVTDVNSHSLGVDYARKIGDRFEDGYYQPIIHRNTVIPTSQTSEFLTIHHNQTFMTFHVYEGESRRVKNNRLIGEIEIQGIPRGPAGQRVEITFTYDQNGILEVEVCIPDTGKKVAKLFNRGANTLTESQIEKAKTRIARLKEDPRKNPRYRDLLLRAEGIWTELTREARGMLEHGMDLLESAMRTHNPDSMEKAYEFLFRICEELDEGERW